MKKELSKASQLLLQKHKEKKLCNGSQKLLELQDIADTCGGNFQLKILQHQAEQEKEMDKAMRAILGNYSEVTIKKPD